MKLIIGNIYEVEARIKISWNGIPSWRHGFFKLIGFSQSNEPVFQDDNKFFAARKDDYLIKSLK